ncbi:WD40 repeat domain-containing protein [Frankia sp. Cpl3]|nr:WD40 repeat domain-containing protein [Frankia sp. Cpl3]
MIPSASGHTTPDDRNRPTVDDVSAPQGQAIGVNYGHILQQRFSGPFRLLRDATIPLDPLPGDLRLSDPANPDNPVARFRGRADLIYKIDAFINRCVLQRWGAYLLVEAEAGMGKSALAAYLAFTRVWPAHFTRLPEGRTPETARRNLAAQLIARWKLDDATPGGVLPADADATAWLYSRLCDAARIRDKTEPGQPVVLLVDGLDEAPPSKFGELPLGLPLALPPGTAIVATTRPKTVAIPTGSRDVERIDVESAANRQDLFGYLTAVSAHDPLIAAALRRNRMPADRFCSTLLDRSGGVWIYALTLLDQVRHHDRDPRDVDRLPVGLVGYYADNLNRWRADLGDHAWQAQGLPVLATLTAIREPQTATAIATFAGVADSDTRALLRRVFRPFLATRRGASARQDLYLPRHQSLRDFTTGTAFIDSDDDDLRDLADDLATATHAAHLRIAAALTPSEPIGQRNWPNSSSYALKYLPEHAALAKTLPGLLNDPEFALHVGIPSLLQLKHHLTDPQALAALSALQLAYGYGDTQAARLEWIEVSARKTQAHTLADSTARLLSDRPLRPAHAIWNGTSHHLTGHIGWVSALAAVPLPDGRTLLASTGGEQMVRLWDPTTGQPVGEPLTGHTDWVNALAAVPLPDGRTLLASTSDDLTVRLWDPINGQPVGEPLTGHTDAVTALAAIKLPDGRTLLASTGGDRTIRLWDPTGGQPVGEPLTGHTRRIHALASITLPEGGTLLAATSDNRTVLWDPSSGQPVSKPLTGHTDTVTALASIKLPDRRTLLASTSTDRAIVLWTTDRVPG